MKKILSVVLILVLLILVGCDKNVSSDKTVKKEETPPPIPTITETEAKAKLTELATGLELRYDDMKEKYFCRCEFDDVHPRIWIVPYVTLDKNFNVSLWQDVMYIGTEPLYFQKVYIKTKHGVENFQYKDVVRSYGGEEHVGKMNDNLYKKLKEGIEDGYIKIRLEGRIFGDRELTSKELSDFKKVFAVYEFFSNVKVEQ